VSEEPLEVESERADKSPWLELGDGEPKLIIPFKLELSNELLWDALWWLLLVLWWC